MCSCSSAASSSWWSAGSIGSSSTETDLEIRPSARSPASAMPTATAHTRLNRTVAARVSHMTAASARVERARASIEPTSIMRTEVAMSTPASAASGTCATSGASVSIMSASTIACVRDESRPAAPDRTFTAVRASAPEDGMPPKNGVTRFATPWPSSSRSGL